LYLRIVPRAGIGACRQKSEARAKTASAENAIVPALAMLLHAATIFLSALLLFLVQPLIAKQILPWFGGAAAVWTTCLLFFQSALLAGYGYAHAVTKVLKPRRQAQLHATLLAVSLLFLPIVVSPSWKPPDPSAPTLRILGMLSASIGLPYLLLSTTTPLLQAWFFQRFRSAQPYRLFALSNLGSLLALPAYPLLLEPFLGSLNCARLWSVLYALFAICCALTGWFSVRAASSADPAPAAVSSRPALLPKAHVASWLLLSSASTCLLLSVTNHLTQNVASVPFLWVLPLAIYLFTFIICFDRPAWYRRPFFMTLSAGMIIIMAFRINSLELAWVAPLFALGLFSACMFCHGELARLRPDPGHLTIYYLCISLGGALGALLVAVLAPVALKGFFELHIVLLWIGVLLVARSWSYGFVARTVAVLVVLLVGYFDFAAFHATTQGLREIDRNFYGVVRVRDWKRVAHLRAMYHGSITHGCQYLDPAKAMKGACYVSPTSAYGRVMRALEGKPRKVGVIGLGAGSLMAYARPHDEWVFYELDPMVVEIAERQFSFQRLSPAKAKYVLGDGRLSLEREAPRGYDLLAIDAFSGDSIPMHLITREAMEVYVKHLRPDGVIVFQATNRYVDLLPVIRRLADEFGMQTAWIEDLPPRSQNGDFAFETDQVIVTKNTALLQSPLIKEASRPARQRADLPLFTDDYFNLFRILML